MADAAILQHDPATLTRPNPPKKQLKLSEVRKLAKEREAKEIRTIVLPQISEEGGGEFVVTYKRMSMQQVVSTGHVNDDVRDLADTMLQAVNEAALTVATQKADRVPVNVASAGVMAAIEEYGATEYERVTAELKKAMVCAAVIKPQIVPTDDELDYTDEENQLPYDWIPMGDQTILYNAINGYEVAAVEDDLKSVPAEPEGGEEGSEAGEQDASPEDSAEAVPTPEGGREAEHERGEDGGDRPPSLADGAQHLVPRGDSGRGQSGKGVRTRTKKRSAEG